MNRSIYNKITIKFFMYFVFMTFFIFLFPENVAARDYHVPDGILTNYFGSGGDITLPDDVQKVGVSVFKDNKDITSVVIPEGCFAIEDGAFEGCSNLRTISLPSTLDSIGLLAFHDCTSLEYIILPLRLEEEPSQAAPHSEQSQYQPTSQKSALTASASVPVFLV